ncbi:MAG: anhydro-N-acetylmuramic acid kinase [Methylovulum sp.]|nr:anhydro-N-acetylmuramic acid kinase [Methylovulum sp.]
MPELYVGLMSGTSLDGIDAALVDFKNNTIRLVDFEFQPFPYEIKTALQQLGKADALISLQDYGSLDTQLGHLFAAAVHSLLTKTNIPAASINAIGSHGQTIYHSPDSAFPFSLQIGDPNIIAEKTAIKTVADFRRRDLAANGQGAPLVPAFHQAVFGGSNKHRCIVNIGGIANITVLPAGPSAPVIGFDTGPGNTLIDQWIQRHQHSDYDPRGAWAKTGTINHEWVRHLMQDAYFMAPAPKSTGKEYFSLDWVERQCAIDNYRPEDIQASLCYLTAISLCEAIQQYAPATEQVLVCGGGSHNDYLLQLIEQSLSCQVASTELCGIHPDHVEAMAFAWLARQTINHLPGNLKEVTGADHAVILGGIYQRGLI